MSNTECNRCGDCCRVICVNLTKRRMREGTVEDAMFVLKHWHRISRAEARLRNPGVLPHPPDHYYYECDAFDAEQNLCTAQDDKPMVCKGFPWYGRDPNDSALKGLSRCSFWTDVPAELHPAYVQMGETRKAS